MDGDSDGNGNGNGAGDEGAAPPWGRPPAGDPSVPATPPPGPPPFEPPRFEAPPSFEAPPAFGTPFGAPAGTAGDPGAPPDLPPPVAPAAPKTSNLKALIATADPVDTPRPTPTFASMVAVAGGLLAAAGLFALLSELDGYDQRVVGLVISLLFVALGVAISVLNRSSRAAAGGVALSLLGVVPFTGYLFANANLFDLFTADGSQGDPWDGIRWTVTLMLGTAALLWLAGYLFVPTRRFGAYLGAALVAIWLIPLFNLQLTAIEDSVSPFLSSPTFEPIPTDPGFDSGFDDPTFEDDFGQFDEDLTQFEEPEISDPSTKMGVVSLAFGAAYLALAGWRDRKGDARMATAALVPAILALYYGWSLLAAHIGWVGRGLLGIAVGAAVLALGLRGARRASSWIGMFLATVALGSLVVEGLRESPRAIGAVLTVLGVVLALLVGRAGSGQTRHEPAPESPLPPPDPTPAPTAGPEPSPWSQSF